MGDLLEKIDGLSLREAIQYFKKGYRIKSKHWDGFSWIDPSKVSLDFIQIQMSMQDLFFNEWIAIK